MPKDKIYIHLYKKKILVQFIFPSALVSEESACRFNSYLGQHRFGLFRVGGERGLHDSGAAYWVSLWHLQTGLRGLRHGLCGLVAAKPSR